jgi:hypothetical protein
VRSVEEKLVQYRLRWFGHIKRRPQEALVRSGIMSRADNVMRQRQTKLDLGGVCEEGFEGLERCFQVV